MSIDTTKRTRRKRRTRYFYPCTHAYRSDKGDETTSTLGALLTARNRADRRENRYKKSEGRTTKYAEGIFIFACMDACMDASTVLPWTWHDFQWRWVREWRKESGDDRMSHACPSRWPQQSLATHPILFTHTHTRNSNSLYGSVDTFSVSLSFCPFFSFLFFFRLCWLCPTSLFLARSHSSILSLHPFLVSFVPTPLHPNHQPPPPPSFLLSFFPSFLPSIHSIHLTTSPPPHSPPASSTTTYHTLDKGAVPSIRKQVFDSRTAGTASSTHSLHTP